MVMFHSVAPHNYLVWASLLPTPVTQAMFWLERSPGPVRTQTVEPQEHGVGKILLVSKSPAKLTGGDLSVTTVKLCQGSIKFTPSYTSSPLPAY